MVLSRRVELVIGELLDLDALSLFPPVLASTRHTLYLQSQDRYRQNTTDYGVRFLNAIHQFYVETCSYS